MSSEEERPLKFPVDTFTKRGTYAPDGPPFTVPEYNKFYNAYSQYLEGARSINATFLNGMQLHVKYNFDATRAEGDRLFINWDRLVPIFGGVKPPGDRNYVRVPVVLKFIKEHLHLKGCQHSLRDTCPCKKESNKASTSYAECADKHFHHFCTKHIQAWVIRYLVPVILLKESRELFQRYIAESHGDCPFVLEYYEKPYNTGTEILLDSALGTNDFKFIEGVYTSKF